jgi:hypothetical protein
MLLVRPNHESHGHLHPQGIVMYITAHPITTGWIGTPSLPIVIIPGSLSLMAPLAALHSLLLFTIPDSKAHHHLSKNTCPTSQESPSKGSDPQILIPSAESSISYTSWTRDIGSAAAGGRSSSGCVKTWMSLSRAVGQGRRSRMGWCGR